MLDWISGLIDSMGGVAVGLLMFLENVFPPIPSELIMPLAGFHAASGQTSLVAVVLWGTLGSLAGAWLWYWIGQRLGADRLRRLCERHGRWLGVSPDELDKARDWFDRNGGKAVLIGRLVPTVRTLISVPAGVTGMPLARFFLFSAIGTLVWSGALATIGYVLGAQFHSVTDWINRASTVVIVVLIGLYLWRVATYDRRTQRA